MATFHPPWTALFRCWRHHWDFLIDTLMRCSMCWIHFSRIGLCQHLLLWIVHAHILHQQVCVIADDVSSNKSSFVTVMLY